MHVLSKAADASGAEHGPDGRFVGRVPGKKPGQKSAEHRLGVRRYEEVNTSDPKVKEVYPHSRSARIGHFEHRGSDRGMANPLRSPVHAFDRHDRKLGVFSSHADAVKAIADCHQNGRY
jgi:hypothetical protein